MDEQLFQVIFLSISLVLLPKEIVQQAHLPAMLSSLKSMSRFIGIQSFLCPCRGTIEFSSNPADIIYFGLGSGCVSKPYYLKM